MISHFNTLMSQLPNIIQECFCALNGAMNPTIQMKYVPAVYYNVDGDMVKTILSAFFRDILL